MSNFAQYCWSRLSETINVKRPVLAATPDGVRLRLRGLTSYITTKEVGTYMTYIPSETGMVGVADSARILRAVFPNYPDLQPCNSPPTLEPICPIWANSAWAPI
jgi:hypothetical protein